MFSKKEIAIFIALIIAMFLSWIIILSNSYPEIFLILPILIVGFIYINIKRNKKLTPQVAPYFQQLAIKILQERPIGFLEFFQITPNQIIVKPTIMVNNIPIDRYAYKRQFSRVFTIEDVEGAQHLLYCDIKTMWDNEFAIKVFHQKLL